MGSFFCFIPMGLLDFFKKKPTEDQKEKLDSGLEKTRTSLLGKLSKVVLGKSRIDDDFLDDVEELLISSDVGVETTVKIIDRIESRVSHDKYLSESELKEMLQDEIVQLVSENEVQHKTMDVKPYVIMVVGVNGVGKTTTIGKLANLFKSQGLKVVLGAADTFRAAAVDQINIWGDRVGVDVVSKGMNHHIFISQFGRIGITAQTEKHSNCCPIRSARQMIKIVKIRNKAPSCCCIATPWLPRPCACAIDMPKSAKIRLTSP